MKIVRNIFHYTRLESEIDDHDTIHKIIEKDIIFKGTNLWILVFAIIVASVGLNMNSTAVVIGAMLISPLMGPINGLGYSIATYNFHLLRKSIKNFSFAVGASLIASTLYFSISPISTAHSELLARTSPTIYDVLIAFFGGFAGILATSSKMKGNVIPGVAIATALMPPLCTAGYGLATGQFHFFFGALYLFTINSVFIALSAMILCQFLKFPIRTLISNVQKRNINRWISFVIFLILIPSIYFGYKLVVKERFLENAKGYVNNVSIIEGNFLLRYDIDTEEKVINLVYGGTTLTNEQKENIKEKALDFNLNKANITFKQGLSFEEFDRKSSELDNLKVELNKANLLLNERNRKIDSLNNVKYVSRDLLREINSIYPQIQSCSFSESYQFSKDNKNNEVKSYIVIFTVYDTIPDDIEQVKIKKWLKNRLECENIKVFFEK